MREENTPADYITIHIAQGMLRAMTLRGCLENASIPVSLSYESSQPIPGLASEGQGRVKVMVPKVWEKEARALLNANPRPGEIFCVPPE